MVKGTVEALEAASENTPWKVKLGGKTYSTFKDEIVGNLKVGMTIEFEPEKVTAKNGRVYYNLAKWEELIGNEEPELVPVAAPTTDWDAKDRAIAMESSYSSAARMMQAVAQAGHANIVSVESLTAIARSIYQDVQLARENKVHPTAFPSAPPKTTPELTTKELAIALQEQAARMGWNDQQLRTWLEEHEYLKGKHLSPAALPAMIKLPTSLAGRTS